MRDVRFLTPAGDVLSYEAEDGRTVVCDQGSPEYFAVVVTTEPAQFVPPQIVPTLADYTAALDAQVEATARGRGYNGGAQLASYAVSTVPGWREEAAAFVAWRDAVWLRALAIFNGVQAGEIAPPAVADLVAGLPAPKWPEGVQNDAG